jgi:hypothetical protein
VEKEVIAARKDAASKQLQERTQVKALAAEAKKDIRDPRFLKALGQVQTEDQYNHVMAVYAATPQALTPEQYDQQKELQKVRQTEQLKQNINIAGIPAKQAAELPGEVEKKRVLESVFTAPPEVKAELSAFQREEAQRGAIPEGLTQDEYITQHPGAYQAVQKQIAARKEQEAITSALNKQAITADAPLHPVDAQRYINPETGQKLPAQMPDGRLPTQRDAGDLKMIPMGETGQAMVGSRLRAVGLLDRLEPLLFGGKGKDGVDHPGIFKEPKEGWPAGKSGVFGRAKQTVGTYLEGVSQSNQLGVDIRLARATEDGALGVYARVFGDEKGNLQEQEQQRAKNLLPLFSLQGTRLADSPKLARAKFTLLREELMGGITRLIGPLATPPATAPPPAPGVEEDAEMRRQVREQIKAEAAAAAAQKER